MAVPLRVCKVPAGGGLGEVFGMLILAEGDFRFYLKHAAAAGLKQRQELAAIFAVIYFSHLLPERAIFDFLHRAFHDHRLVGFFGADHAVGIRGDVLRLARARAGAEPECPFPPDAPNDHEVRAALRPCGSDPIVVRFFEPLDGPAPGLEAGGGIWGILQRIRPVRPARLRFAHVVSVGVLRLGAF